MTTMMLLLGIVLSLLAGGVDTPCPSVDAAPGYSLVSINLDGSFRCEMTGEITGVTQR